MLNQWLRSQRQTLFQILGIAALLGLLSLVVVMQNAVNVSDFGPNDIFEMLAILTFVATLQQTAVGTFISSWRDPGKAPLKEQLAQVDLELAQEDLSAEAAKPLKEKRAEIQRKKRQYKLETRKIAQWANLLSAIFVSLVGVRALESLMDPTEIDQLSQYQSFGFHLMDVLLTGALIAGGTEGIQQVSKVFNNFVKTSPGQANSS